MSATNIRIALLAAKEESGISHGVIKPKCALRGTEKSLQDTVT